MVTAITTIPAIQVQPPSPRGGGLKSGDVFDVS
jgi:hypothetical protein